MMTSRKAAGIALLAVATLAAYFLLPRISDAGRDNRTSTSYNAQPLSSKIKQEKIFICPMHPEIIQSTPGACPICGMDLVESQHPNHDHSYGIQVDTASLQKLGVRLASVKKSVISDEIRSFGNVALDEAALYNVHTKYDGWIKKVHIHSIGQQIEKGQVIYEIYSPDLIMRQKEYLRFLERRNQILQTVGDVRLQENEYVMSLLTELSVERTKFLHEDMDIETVKQLEDNKMPFEVVKIVAAQSGVVTQINAREGSSASPADTLFTLANTGKVWVDIALYPDQAGMVKKGDGITIIDASGQYISKIDFINPIASDNKVSARATLNNNAHRLRPGSFVDVDIHAQPHEALVLPRSAVLRGGDGDRVMLLRGEGHFIPVYIETGIENGEWIEIKDGLLEGAEVAVNGQFLLDSAASMSAAAERMTSGRHEHDAE